MVCFKVESPGIVNNDKAPTSISSQTTIEPQDSVRLFQRKQLLRIGRAELARPVPSGPRVRPDLDVGDFYHRH